MTMTMTDNELRVRGFSVLAKTFGDVNMGGHEIVAQLKNEIVVYQARWTRNGGTLKAK